MATISTVLHDKIVQLSVDLVPIHVSRCITIHLHKYAFNKAEIIFSEKKTKFMLFNFTNNYQFTTRMQLEGENIKIVDQMIILGTVVTSFP